MIRLFNVYYPSRTLVLLMGEALVVSSSFLLAVVLTYQADSYLVLNFQYGYIKIVTVTAVALLCSHWCDLYDPPRLGRSSEVYFRLLLVVSLLSFILAGVGYAFPGFILGKEAFLLGLIILTLALLGWRTIYSWISQHPSLREHVYVLGTGEMAERLISGLNGRSDLGVEVVGCSGDSNGADDRDVLAAELRGAARRHRIDRVILAVEDRRGTIPMEELLRLRLSGTKVETSTSWLEKISGRIELDGLRPGWLIFSDGFKAAPRFAMLSRVAAMVVSGTALLLLSPLMAVIAIAISLDSKGPILFRQARVGKNGKKFQLYKFRSMYDGGDGDQQYKPAQEQDDRITRVGRWLRRTRLDEIPQLYNILRGDMCFVGPRPFVVKQEEELAAQIPYYTQRWLVTPGVTGWAQINREYCATLEDNIEKLGYDLFYIKNRSVGLDLFIMFQTVKILILGRGAR
ncbi:MAG TPA: TIGR03013 family XrtA/PEP-CTERM system glycosyltransferase [Terriglobales bacterium]|nr:TIGR03013 family XrtA/PEP-CTERM system glycosyltransferase [Terriglobales bacterium]